MSTSNLSAEWLDEDDIEEVEDTVFGGSSESPYIQGYGVHTVKVAMAKVIKYGSSKVEFIELDMVNQDGKLLREKFMVRGKDNNTFYKRNGKKFQHFGINKIKSLMKVSGQFEDTDSSKYMATIYGGAEKADVTYSEYGKEKTEEFLTFPELIGLKVKIAVTSKKENSQTNADQDDEAEQKYVKDCIRRTKAFIAANPKKKSLKKFDKSEGYVNVFKWFTNSTVAHFIGMNDCFAGESSPKKINEFLEANDEGVIFDGRTLFAEELSDSDLAKVGINKYGKRVEAEDSEPVETEDEELDDTEEKW